MMSLKIHDSKNPYQTEMARQQKAAANSQVWVQIPLMPTAAVIAATATAAAATTTTNDDDDNDDDN